MGSNLRIEEIDLSDMDAVLPLLERFFAEHGFSAADGDLRIPLSAMIADPDSVVLVCHQSDEPVGVITGTTSIGLEYGRSAEIEDLYVIREARRQGIASSLVDQALEWCRERGCSTVMVTIAAAGTEGEDLAAFYQRHGFRSTARTLMEVGIGRPREVDRLSGRITVRTPRAADLTHIVSLWTDARVTRYIGGPRTPDAVLAHFRDYIDDPQAMNARGREWWWSILEGEDGEFIGLGSLMAKDVDGKDEMELGYFLLPEGCGRGNATEASRLILDFAFSGLGLESVIALIDPRNEASARVARRLGMRMEGEITRDDGSVRQIFRVRW